MTYYLLRQPETLENLAIDQLAVWIGIQAENLMSPISELQQQDTTKAEAVLSRQIEIIRNRLQYNMPTTAHNTLLSKTIEELHRLVETKKKIIGRMVETLFTENVTSLALCYSQFITIQESLESKSHMLTGLTRLKLKLDTSSTSFKGDMNTHAIQLLKNLTNLKYLSIYVYCGTDKTLLCITKNCTLIEELSLGGFSASNKNIQILSQLTNLREIQLPHISSIGGETLLFSCQNIENIVIPYKYLDIGEITLVLNRFASSNVNSEKRFKLKSYRCFDKFEHLKIVFKLCPLIQTLAMVARSRTVTGPNRKVNDNIMATIELHNLRDLTLEEYGFYHDKLERALNVVGSNLEHLRLLRCEEIDLNSLIDISQMCPNLKSLTLDYCTFKDQTSCTKKFKIPPFRNLKTLAIDMSMCFYFPNETSSQIQENSRERQKRLLTSKKLKLMHEPVFFLLTNCLNVEFIEFTRTVPLPQDVLLNILDKNPLTYLKELKIVQCNKMPRTMTELSPLVIDRIINNSINSPEVIQILSLYGLTRQD